MILKRGILQIFFLYMQVAGVLAQEALLTSGGDISGSGGSASYSIGQVLYIFNTGNNGTEAQGVQQPYEISAIHDIENTNNLKTAKISNSDSFSYFKTKSEDVKFINLKCIAYPNPTNDILTLTIDFPDKKNRNLSYKLFDFNGKLLENEKVKSSNTNIFMGNLVSATYILNIFQGNQSVKTFKIVKN